MKRRVERTINSKRKEPKMMKYEDGGPIKDLIQQYRETVPTVTKAIFAAGADALANTAINKSIKNIREINKIRKANPGMTRKQAKEEREKKRNNPLAKRGGVPCAKCGMSMKKGGSANKKLAAMYGDPNKITRGDIITAAKRKK